MTNKVFIDSSVLIEPLRNRKVDFFYKLIANINFKGCINAIVVSEYLYKYIGLQNAGSPKTVESRGEIAKALQPYLLANTLLEFQYLQDHSNLVFLIPQLMAKYNLLPNDAIILATCKLHNIPYLATHDSDFDAAAPAEGIQLLKEGDNQLTMDN